MLSCRLDGLAVDLPAKQQDVDWVRTAQGWERRTAWFSSDVSPVQLHPIVVATGQVLLSIFALALCAAGPEQEHLT